MNKKIHYLIILIIAIFSMQQMQAFYVGDPSPYPYRHCRWCDCVRCPECCRGGYWGPGVVVGPVGFGFGWGGHGYRHHHGGRYHGGKYRDGYRKGGRKISEHRGGGHQHRGGGKRR